jgi:CheY-like chemotaxis protein
MRKIVVIDDDALVLRSLVRQLERPGYEVVGFTSGCEALPHLSEDVALVASDYNLPAMDGVAIARAVRARCPNTKVLLLTGSTETEAIAQAMQQQVVNGLLFKPWSLGALRGLVDDLLGR